MLRFLFPGLTPPEQRGAPLFTAVVAAARRPHWFRDGGVPDSIDGRFAVLATLIAMTTVRLEQAGEEGEAAAVALTERFVEAMDAEHRQLGLNDPKLGRVVRKLLGSVAKRVEQWRRVAAGEADWRATSSSSLYQIEAADSALDHGECATRDFWKLLQGASDGALARGELA